MPWGKPYQFTSCLPAVKTPGPIIFTPQRALRPDRRRPSAINPLLRWEVRVCLRGNRSKCHKTDERTPITTAGRTGRKRTARDGPITRCRRNRDVLGKHDPVVHAGHPKGRGHAEIAAAAVFPVLGGPLRGTPLSGHQSRGIPYAHGLPPLDDPQPMHVPDGPCPEPL